jgi:hypothetical protein
MRAYRCPGCRTRRSTLPLLKAHLAASGHTLCNCGGYHYVHRPGSPCCVRNPVSALWMAMRQGEERDVLHEIAAYVSMHWPDAAQRAKLFIDTYVN